MKTSCCGGESAAMFELTTGLFDSMMNASDSDAEARLVAYLWKTLDVMGMRPEIDRCSGCGLRFPVEAISGRSRMHYDQGSEGFFCPTCGGDKPRFPEALRGKLEDFADGLLEGASFGDLDAANIEDMKKMVFAFTQTAAEGSLLSLTML
jgi:recombinational DNA repair protein (RecF pathway)